MPDAKKNKFNSNETNISRNFSNWWAGFVLMTILGQSTQPVMESRSLICAM